MIQTLDLPVLSLAIPNIHKLNDINTDNLSCMWTVFSKCKDNLENGRRLENMSWRLWYRESTLKENIQLSSTCPIPIQQSNIKKDTTDHHKHLSPASFKRIISSLNQNEDILPPPSIHSDQLIMLQQPQQPQQQQEFTSEEYEEDEEEEGWSSEEEEELTPKNKVFSTTKKFIISDDEDTDYEDEEEEGENKQQQQQDNQSQDNTNEMAFLSEFRKRVPITNVINRGSSILSNMLRAQGSTRLANTANNVVQNQTTTTEQQQQQQHEELSTSMRKYVEWEKHGYQHDFILDSKNHSIINYSFMDHSFSRNCW